MSTPAQPIKLYWHPLSGHSHRVQLFMSLTGIPFEIKHIELTTAEQRSDDYRAVNPNAKLPAIDDGGTIVDDSAAILFYLATKYEAARSWLPTEPLALAGVIRSLVFASGPAEFGPADSRLLNLTGGDPQMIDFLAAGHVDHDAAMGFADTWLPRLDKELASKRFLVEDRPTIADVINYTAIAYADEGGVDLAP